MPLFRKNSLSISEKKAFSEISNISELTSDILSQAYYELFDIYEIIITKEMIKSHNEKCRLVFSDGRLTIDDLSTAQKKALLIAGRYSRESNSISDPDLLSVGNGLVKLSVQILFNSLAPVFKKKIISTLIDSEDETESLLNFYNIIQDQTIKTLEKYDCGQNSKFEWFIKSSVDNILSNTIFSDDEKKSLSEIRKKDFLTTTELENAYRILLSIYNSNHMLNTGVNKANFEANICADIGYSKRTIYTYNYSEMEALMIASRCRGDLMTNESNPNRKYLMNELSSLCCDVSFDGVIGIIKSFVYTSFLTESDILNFRSSCMTDIWKGIGNYDPERTIYFVYIASIVRNSISFFKMDQMKERKSFHSRSHLKNYAIVKKAEEEIKERGIAETPSLLDITMYMNLHAPNLDKDKSKAFTYSFKNVESAVIDNKFGEMMTSAYRIDDDESSEVKKIGTLDDQISLNDGILEARKPIIKRMYSVLPDMHGEIFDMAIILIEMYGHGYIDIDEIEAQSGCFALDIPPQSMDYIHSVFANRSEKKGRKMPTMKHSKDIKNVAIEILASQFISKRVLYKMPKPMLVDIAPPDVIAWDNENMSLEPDDFF